MRQEVGQARLLIAVLAVVALSAGVQAQTASGARLLRVAAPVGAAYKFMVSMRAEAVNADGAFSADITLAQRVTGRTAEEVTWAVETSTGAIASRGVFAGIEKSLGQLNGLAMTRVTDVRGQTKSLAVGNRAMASTGTPDITFPQQPVSPGDSWTAEVENSGRTATIRYTYKRRESTGRREVLIVEGVYEPGQYVSTVTPHVFRLDAADGVTIDATGTVQIDLGGAIMRMTFNMSRLPGAK